MAMPGFLRLTPRCRPWLRAFKPRPPVRHPDETRVPAPRLEAVCAARLVGWHLPEVMPLQLLRAKWFPEYILEDMEDCVD